MDYTPTVKIREDNGGLCKSTEYHFVLDGNKVVHISKYSRLVDRGEGYREYEVDLDKLKGRDVVQIVVTDSCIICKARVFPAEELARDWSQRAEREESLSTLNGRELDYLTPDEKKFLESDWRRYYLRMVEEIKRLEGSLGVPILILSDVLRCQLESGADYPLSYLIPYSSRARKMSLENLGKEMHQVWATLKIFDGLRRSGFNVTDADLSFGQSPDRPLFTVASSSHAYSFWYEFDLYPRTMCKGFAYSRVYPMSPGWWFKRIFGDLSDVEHLEQEMRAKCPALYSLYERAASYVGGGQAAGRPILSIFESRQRVALRPDIVVLEDTKSCDDICREGVRAKLIVELKDRDYEEWEGDVESQIIPYNEIFRPERMVVASVKPVPEGAKARLRSKGIEVVDGVYPGGPGEGALVDAVKGALTG